MFVLFHFGIVYHTLSARPQKQLFLQTNRKFLTQHITPTSGSFQLYFTKNLAIANRSRVSCAQYAKGIYKHKYYTVTLKSRLRVTQGHWKQNHWTDHTRLS